jgi:DNA-binding GntR family transcriptional regulator
MEMLDEALGRGDARAALLAHTDFHSIVVAAAGNGELNRLIADRYPLIERLMLLRMRQFVTSEMLDINRAIYAALTRGDHERAIALGEAIRARFATALELLYADR